MIERQQETETLRIATTTSLDDSGLLNAILPDLEQRHGIRTEVIAVGTGQALVLGERGDVALVLVHAPDLEQEFVEQGYGVERTTLMTNPFILVGPADDPAGVSQAGSVADAFLRVAASESPFVSRGDDSGTHMKEREIWQLAGLQPEPESAWYHAAGQGMGESLLMANELVAYTLTDRATFVAIDDARVGSLTSLFGSPDQTGFGDPALENPYSVIAVDPDRHPNARVDLARIFIEWLTSAETRTAISEYGVDEFGDTLFTLVD